MRAVTLGLTIVLALIAPTWAQAPALRVEDAQGPAGASVQVNVVLTSAPRGLQQYVFVFSVEDTTRAAIEEVRGVKLSGNLFQISAQEAGSVEFRALDLNDEIKPGDEDVVLARVTLRLQAEGATRLVLTVKAFVDDDGLKVEPEVSPGVLTVGAGGAPVPPSPSSPSEAAVPRPLEPEGAPPQDLDGDGLFEDVDGDGQLSSDDAALLLNHLNDPQVQEDAAFFDFNADGRLDNADVVALLNRIGQTAPPPAVQPPRAPVLRLEEARAGVGETVTVNVVLEEAADGLETYALRLRLMPGGLARIRAVRSVALPAAFFEVVSRTDEEVVFRGADFDDAIRPGARELVLAQVELEGLQAGTVRLEPTVEVFTADDGLARTPVVRAGQVTFTRGPAPLAPDWDPPRDLDGDGLFEDLNGDGVLDTRDALILAFNLNNPVVQNGVEFFDFNGDGRVTFADAVVLAGMI